MERVSDLALVLKTFRYGERDLVAVLFTENFGRVTALAKGAVTSKRYGGSLAFLSASRVSFVQKPHAEMVRLDEATIHREFAKLAADYDRFTIASFMSEFCLKVLEPHSPSRELFRVLTNGVFFLDEEKPPLLVLNAFLCKALHCLGYHPNLTACTVCERAADDIMKEAEVMAVEAPFYWNENVGGMVCYQCNQARGTVHHTRKVLDVSTLILFCQLSAVPFKETNWDLGEGEQAKQAMETQTKLFRLIVEFLHHHIPTIHSGGGLKSLKLLETTTGCNF